MSELEIFLSLWGQLLIILWDGV